MGGGAGAEARVGGVGGSSGTPHVRKSTSWQGAHATYSPPEHYRKIPCTKSDTVLLPGAGYCQPVVRGRRAG